MPNQSENVFDEKSSTETMYKALVQPIVIKALEGYNGTIFAYGQTSSGKTHSMIGDDGMPGIIPLAVKDVFKEINSFKSRKFLVRVGYIEIYNDKIYDLFDNRRTGLSIFESQGNVVINQKEIIVKSEDEVFKHFHNGNKCKRMVETATNERSSRSHTIFRITVDSINNDGTDAKISNLFLVDLAGSEKPDLTKPTFNEGLHINKSLLVLGKIIRELSKKDSNMKHVNFRECKLTRILSPALGGNCLTAVLCTVSSSVMEETYRTICFAQNAKKAKTYPTFNTASRALMIRKGVRFDTPNSSTSSLLDLSSKRRQALTPIGSVTDLTCPRKKLKFITPKDGSIILHQRVVQCLQIEIADVNKEKLAVNMRLNNIIGQQGTVIENKDGMIKDLQDQLMSSEELINDTKGEHGKIIEEKLETIRALEIQLSEAQKGLFKSRNTYKSMLQAKLDVIETLEKRNLEQLKTANDKIAALQRDIVLFEKSVFDRESAMKEMECRVYKTEKESAEMKQNFDSKIEEYHQQFETFFQQKDQAIKSLEIQNADLKKRESENKSDDLSIYIKLEKHYEVRLEAERQNFGEKNSAMQLEFEEKLSESENHFRKLLSEKDNEINKLKADAQKMPNDTDDSKMLSISHESISHQITMLKGSLSASITDLNQMDLSDVQDIFIKRLGSIFGGVHSLVKNLEGLVTKRPTPVMVASPSLYVPSPSSESGMEQSPAAIRGGACQHCNKTFSRRAALERHLLIKHLNKEQRFECGVCTDVFKTKTALNNHGRVAHQKHA